MGELGRVDGLSVVEVDFAPALPGSLGGFGLVVDEVAALAETAEALLLEGVADLGFVRSIMFHVYPELLGAVGELALLPVRAHALCSVVFAEGRFGLAGKVA